MTRSILDSLVARAATTPDAPFAHVRTPDGTHTITAAALITEAGRWASLLVEDGCKPGETVIIILRHGPDLYPAFLGCVMAGCVPSFMPFLTPKQDPELYWTNHDTLFRRIQASCVITWPENARDLRERIAEVSYRIRVTGEQASLPPLSPWVERGGEAVALLQHSSGTTGLKKGVALSHDAILRQIESYAAALGFQRDDIIASWLPLYHDMGLIACFMLPLIADGTVVSLDAFEWVMKPRQLLTAIEEYQARWCWLPNFAFAHMARLRRASEQGDLSSIKAFINCSEPCKADTFDVFLEAFADHGVTAGQLQVCYAMAETVFAVTQTSPGQPASRLQISPRGLALGRVLPPAENETPLNMLSAGRPIAGIHLRILDDADQDVSNGTVGQIAVSGDFTFSGYNMLPEETAQAFAGAWYRTGDLGFIHNGELFITGRIKDVIIVHGKNVYAHDIEAVANGIPGVKPGRAVAVGAYNATMASEDLVVICETTLTDEAERRALKRAIRVSVEASHGLSGTIAHITDTGWLVKTTSGKISRKENLRKYLSEIQ